MLYVLYSIHAEKGNEILMIGGFRVQGSKGSKGSKGLGGGFAAILADGIPVRKAMTKLCIKILVDADSAMESAFP